MSDRPHTFDYRRWNIPTCPCCGAIRGVNRELAALSGSVKADWKEATEAAEAWCKITDEEGRNHAVYCFRAGYLKAKRQNQNLSHGDAVGTKP